MRMAGISIGICVLLCGCHHATFSGAAVNSREFTQKNQDIIENNLQPDAKRADTAATPWNLAFEPQHYRLLISIDPENQRFSGLVTITVKRKQLEQPLYLDAESSIIVDSVALDSVQLDNWQRLPGKIKIDPQYLLKDEFDLTINYHSGVVRAGAYFVKQKSGVVQFWTHGKPNDARYWLPSFDWPGYKATSEFYIVVPVEWKALSQGEFLGELGSGSARAYHWKEKVKLPSYLFSINAGILKTFEAAQKPVPIKYWLPVKEDAARLLGFKLLPEMIEFFSKLLRPYAFEKFDVGIAYDFLGAMEHASAVTFSQNLYSDRDGYDEGILAHELAHQWFGDLVTCKTWNDLWLNEGFTSYFEVVFWQNHTGQEKFFNRVESYRRRYFTDEVRSKNTLGAIYNPATLPSQKFNVISYEKGALAVHQLRYSLGEEKFFTAIRDYLETYKVKSASTEDLRLSFEKSTGMDLRSFFEQWVMRPSFPEFNYSWQHQSGKVSVKVTQKQNDLYKTPMDLWIIYDKGLDKKRVLIEERSEQSFEFAVNQQPRAVLLDPEHWILGTTSATKPTDEWIYILASGPTMQSKIDAIKGLAPQLNMSFIKKAFETEQNEYVKYNLVAATGRLFSASQPEQNEEIRQFNLSNIRSKSDYIRMAAAQNMMMVGKPADEDVLIEVFKDDPFPYVKMYAGMALGIVGGPKSIQVFKTELYMEPLRDQKLVSAAISGLGSLKATDSADHLLDLFDSKFENARFLKAILANTLASFGDKRATTKICEEMLKEHQPDLSLSYLDALNKLMDKSAVSALVQFLQDETRSEKEKKSATDLLNKLNSVQK